jgi:hypothetical protein
MYDDDYEPDCSFDDDDSYSEDCDCGLSPDESDNVCEDCECCFDHCTCNVEDEDLDLDFQDPGGESALRRATRDNPRNLPCPNCGRPDMLTPKDVALHYVCDICADVAEGKCGY